MSHAWDPTAGDEPASYADAADEIDRLLASLEREPVDVDRLATDVRRAAALLRWCDARLRRARVEVEEVVADLDPDATPPT